MEKKVAPVDPSDMAQRTAWKRLPLRLVDQDVYGRTVAAYCHPSGFLLVHVKHRSRRSRIYRRCGMWLLARGDGMQGEMILRKIYFDRPRPPMRPPIRWANAVLRRVYQVPRSNTQPLLRVVDGDTSPPNLYQTGSYAVSPSHWDKLAAESRRQGGSTKGDNLDASTVPL